MLCPNCESVNRDGAKFCDECGFPLTGAIAARAAEVAASGNAALAEPAASEPREIPEVAQAPEASETPEILEVPEITAVIPAVEADQAAADESAFEGMPESEPAPEAPAQELPVEGEQPTEVIGATEYQPTPEEEALYGENASAPEVTAAIGSDFTGLDRIDDEYGERLVDPGYQEPKADWRDGNTMQMPRVEGEEAPRSKDYLASSTTKQKSNKKLVVGIIVAVIAIAAAVVFATYQMQLWGGKAVPDVRGMTEADATSVLEGNGFKARSTQVKSDDTEGLVLVMDPTAGSRIAEGDEVVIHVATGRSIPAVVGKTEKEAKEAIAEEGYENVTYVNERSDQPEGTVLSISPEPGTRAKSTIAVTVKVAEPYVVPDTGSLGLDAAEAAIHDAGLTYAVAYVDTQDYPDGTVIGTDPVAGTKVKGDTVVTINVARARGIQLVELARGILAPGADIAIGGTNFIVDSITSVNYIGNDQVAFTVNARPYTVFFGVYVEGDMQQVSGVISFTQDNQVSSITQ